MTMNPTGCCKCKKPLVGGNLDSAGKPFLYPCMNCGLPLPTPESPQEKCPACEWALKTNTASGEMHKGCEVEKAILAIVEPPQEKSPEGWEDSQDGWVGV